MRKMILMLCASFLALTTEITCVKAENEDFSEPNEETVLVFSLDSQAEEMQFYDNEGLLTTVVVSDSSLDGIKTISLNNSHISMSFKIYISQEIIQKAYSGSYTIKDSTKVTGTSLKVDSVSQATYKVYGIYGNAAVTRWLRANIKNDNVVVTYR